MMFQVGWIINCIRVSSGIRNVHECGHGDPVRFLHARGLSNYGITLSTPERSCKHIILMDVSISPKFIMQRVYSWSECIRHEVMILSFNLITPSLILIKAFLECYV